MSQKFPVALYFQAINLVIEGTVIPVLSDHLWENAKWPLNKKGWKLKSSSSEISVSCGRNP